MKNKIGCFFLEHPVDLHFLTARFKCYLGSELNSVKELPNTIKIFSLFTCLKSNLGKGEISGVGALKGVTVVVCRIKCIDLTK